MTKDAATIARAGYEAFADKDRAAIEALIAPDFHFTSPLDNRIGRATYLERCWPNSERIEGFEFVHLVPHGDRVFVTYEGRMRDGRIAEVEVYFGWNIPHKAPPGGFLEDGAA